MASNNCLLLLLISLSSLLITFPACEARDAVAAPAEQLLVSYISSSPYASPSPSPSIAVQAAAYDAELGIALGGGAPEDVQAQVTKVIEKTVIGIKAKTDEFVKDVITKRLNDPATEASAKNCLKQCEENYDSANEDVTKVLDDLSTRDFYKASVDLDAIATDVDTCSECVKEMVGDDPEFTKFDEWVAGVTGDCLGELQRINS